MHKLLIYLITTTTLLVTPTVFSDNEAWLLIKEKKGVKAYKRHQPSNSLYAFKGEGIINASIDKVLTVLLDDKRATEWIPRLSLCEIIDRQHWPKQFTQYSIFNAPWPVKDRFFSSEVSVSTTADQRGVNIVFSNITDFTNLTTPLPDMKKLIHGSIAGSHYNLVAIDQNTTRFIAISIVQPRGKIPAWLINWAGSSMPFDTIKQLNKQLAKGNVNVPLEITQLLNTSTHTISDNKFN